MVRSKRIKLTARFAAKIPIVELKDPLDLSIRQLAEAMTECFEGYIVPIAMSPTLLSRMIRADGIDLASCVIAVEGDSIVGIMLTAKRGRIARVAGMAVHPDWRGKGVGKRLILRAIEDAIFVGSKEILLEVIDTNEPALRLYESVGFDRQRRLIGGSIRLSKSGDSLPGASLNEMIAAMMSRPAEEFAWQIGPIPLAHCSPAVRVLSFEGAYLAYEPIPDGPVVGRGICLSGLSDEQKLERLISAVGAAFPGQSLRFPPLFPEPTYGSVLQAAGLEAESFGQYQMGMILSG